MTYGLSTRAFGTPVGTAGPYSRQPATAVVPLSVFFLRMQGEDGGEGESGLYGLRKRDKKRAEPKAKRQTPAEKDKEPAEEATFGGTLGPTKVGLTRLMGDAMGSGNVAQYPVPLGQPLRRVAPVGGAKKRRRTEDERRAWAARLVGMAGVRA